DPPATPTPTVTHYDQVSANFSKAFEALLAVLPHFVESHPSTKGFVRTQKTVSDEFLVSTIAAVEETPGMLGLNQFDVSEARDSLQYGLAFRPIRDKLFAAAKNVDFSINLRRANVVEPALQTYVVVKGLARNPAGTLAASHAGNMKRDLGRAGRNRKKKPAPTPAPVPPVSAPAKSPAISAIS
ncbi:MAG TPA: hypothetical protein VHY33_06680, partial [Thermoanaerobaculia bacterium]|nr:hypothetical protein [Thermoanaerobaculia bacterium]